MKMSELIETINHWSTMRFSENPFGKPIPGIFLFSPELVKTPFRDDAPKCLADLSQDGSAIALIVNDRQKTSLAERANPVVYSEIFHTLLEAGTLCPSNFVSVIIQKLDEQNAAAVYKMTFMEYVGYITRGLRAFASYVRELHLAIIIKQYLYNYAYNYEVFETSAQEDIEKHTDIKFRVGQRYYRVWSYQSTDKGIEKTHRRILNGCGEGYNILLPFDRFKTIHEVNGWHLYNRGIVFMTLKNLLCRRAIGYDEVVNRINEFGDFGLKAQIFFVQN